MLSVRFRPSSHRSPPRTWRGFVPVAVLAALALAWTLLPETIGGLRGDAARVAPGSFWPTWVSYAAALACLAAGFAMGSRTRTFHASLDWLLFLALVWLVAAMAAHVADPLRVFGLSKGLAAGRFTATLLNANTAGCVAAMATILATARYLDALSARLSSRARERRRALVMIGICAGLMPVAVLAMILSGSRMAVLLGLSFAAVLIVGARDLRGRHPRPFWAFAGAALAAIPIGFLWAGRSFLDKIGDLGEDGATRLADTAYYFDLSLRAPLFGHGLGSFRTVNLQNLDAASAEQRWSYGAAHNAILHAAIEGGWPFALFCIGAVALAAAALWRTRRRWRADIMMRGTLLAVAAAMLCGLIDIALNVPAALALTAWLGGLALGHALAGRAAARRPGHRTTPTATRSEPMPESSPASP